MNDKKPPSAVRKSLGDLAPKLVDLTEESCSATSGSEEALQARSQLDHVRGADRDGEDGADGVRFPNAIKNGVTREEVVEMITHLAFYVGWPNAMSAVNRAKELFAKKEGT